MMCVGLVLLVTIKKPVGNRRLKGICLLILIVTRRALPSILVALTCFNLTGQSVYFAGFLGTQLKTEHNLRLLCCDVLDLCRHEVPAGRCGICILSDM